MRINENSSIFSSYFIGKSVTVQQFVKFNQLLKTSLILKTICSKLNVQIQNIKIKILFNFVDLNDEKFV